MRDRTRTPIYKYDEVYNSYQYSTLAGTCTAGPGPLNIQVKKNLGEACTLSIQEGMSDIVTPNFKKWSAQGKIINNPMSKFKTVLNSEIFEYDLEYGLEMLLACNPAKWVHSRDYRYVSKRSIADFFGFTSLSLADEDLQTEIDKAVSSAFSRIGNDKVLALASVKEFGATVTGLVYILKKVFRIYRYTKRAELKRLRGELSFSELQEIYMNARYNLRPLAYDVAGMVEVFNDSTNPGRQTFRASSNYKDESVSSEEFTMLSQLNFDLKGTVTRRAYLEVVVRAGVLTQVGPVTKSQLLGLDKIIETAWDLLPFSFIIDWFVNVGDTLCAWTPKFGFKTLASWVTIDSLLTQNTTIGGLSLTEKEVSGQRLKSPNLLYSGTSATKISSTFERRINPARAIIPSIDVNLDALKILDLAIITKKLFKLKNFRDLRV